MIIVIIDWIFSSKNKTFLKTMQTIRLSELIINLLIQLNTAYYKNDKHLT